MKSIEWLDAELNKPDKFTSDISFSCACKCVTEGIRSNKINYYTCYYRFDLDEWISIETGRRYYITHFIQIEK